MTQQSPKSWGETAQPRSLGGGGRETFIYFLSSSSFPLSNRGRPANRESPLFLLSSTVVSSPHTHCFPFWEGYKGWSFLGRLPAALNEFVQKHLECVWALVSRRKRKEEEKVSQKTVERGQKGKIFMPRVFFCFVVREKDKLCFGAEGEGGGTQRLDLWHFGNKRERERGGWKMSFGLRGVGCVNLWYNVVYAISALGSF